MDKPEPVVLAFVVREAVVKKNGKTAHKDVSRRYHAREAAELFKVEAEKQAAREGRSAEYHVGEIIGMDNV